MRKLVMWNLITLDGYFEGPKPWDLDWHEYAWGPELEQFATERQATDIGALVFGRATYQGMADYWTTEKEKGIIADFMNAVPKFVFSRTLTSAPWNNTRLVTGPPEAEVERLKREPGKDLYIFGSAGLSDTLGKAGLIDEYQLCLTPVVLGGGNPLFKPNPARMRMTLLESKPLKTGGVILRYEPVHADVVAR